MNSNLSIIFVMMKFFPVGKIVGVHGVKGELIISHSLKNTALLTHCDALLIEVWSESIIPFFIKNIEINLNDLYVQFEEINNREDAKKYLQKQVYIYSKENIALEYFNDWNYLKGYKIFSNENYIGLVNKIIDMNGMYIIETTYQNKNVSLPLHEHLIINIDNIQQIIYLEIPAGLLDIY